MDEDYLKELLWMSIRTIVISAIVSAIVSYLVTSI
jgi:hypothetical protein